MKKCMLILLGCFCGILAVSCNSANSSSTKQIHSDKPISIALTNYAEQYPVFSVADTAYDFGTIHEGDVVQIDFKFKNTGTKPLIISEASSTCGCTIPDYQKKPVAPGEESVLKVVFNSAGKMGRQLKPIWVSANTMPSHFTLSISGNVISKEKPAQDSLKSLKGAKTNS